MTINGLYRLGGGCTGRVAVKKSRAAIVRSSKPQMMAVTMREKFYEDEEPIMQAYVAEVCSYTDDYNHSSLSAGDSLLAIGIASLFW